MVVLEMQTRACLFWNHEINLDLKHHRQKLIKWGLMCAYVKSYSAVTSLLHFWDDVMIWSGASVNVFVPQLLSLPHLASFSISLATNQAFPWWPFCLFALTGLPPDAPLKNTRTHARMHACTHAHRLWFRHAKESYRIVLLSSVI